MSRTKGTDVVALRALCKERGREFEAALVASLPPELAKLYQESLAFNWNPVEAQTRLYEAAAEALYPGEPERMMRLGREMARRSYSGVYKVLLRLPSTQFVIGQAAKLWVTYFEQGKGVIIDPRDRTATFAVLDYPDLPAGMRQIVRGNITAVTEMTGVKNIRVAHLDADPMAWKWVVTWE